jgi:hypothetical protein
MHGKAVELSATAAQVSLNHHLLPLLPPKCMGFPSCLARYPGSLPFLVDVSTKSMRPLTGTRIPYPVSIWRRVELLKRSRTRKTRPSPAWTYES